jgi:hypothetical protein
MSSSFYLNSNPNHFNSLIARIEKTDEVFDLEEKNQNLSMNNGMFNFSGDIQEMLLPTNIINDNPHLFSKKDQAFDKSIYLENTPDFCT